MPRTMTAAGMPGARRSVPGGTSATKVRTAIGAATSSSGTATTGGGPLMADEDARDRERQDDRRPTAIGTGLDASPSTTLRERG